MQKGRSMLRVFFPSLEQQPALSKTGHLHMQCISFKIITARREPRRLGTSQVVVPYRVLEMKMHVWKTLLWGKYTQACTRKHANTRLHAWTTHIHSQFQAISMVKTIWYQLKTCIIRPEAQEPPSCLRSMDTARICGSLTRVHKH